MSFSSFQYILSITCVSFSKNPRASIWSLNPISSQKHQKPFIPHPCRMKKLRRGQASLAKTGVFQSKPGKFKTRVFSCQFALSMRQSSIKDYKEVLQDLSLKSSINGSAVASFVSTRLPRQIAPVLSQWCRALTSHCGEWQVWVYPGSLDWNTVTPLVH